MQQIEMAINYARSLAIRHANPMLVCPYHANRGCGNDWRHGILVLAPNGRREVFRVFMPAHAELNFRQSGFSKQKVRIEADGLTYYNGSFNYKSRKFCAFPQFKLYFNKALRVYVVIGDGQK